MDAPTVEATTDLRSRRKQLGISQQRLAVAADCSVSAVRLFEAGFMPARSPTRERVDQVLAALEAEHSLNDATPAVTGAAHAAA